MHNTAVASRIKALTFDVFGTVVDWRSGMIRDGQSLRAALDWATLADRWHSLYHPTLQRVMRDELPWASADALQRTMLEQVLAEHPDHGLQEAQRAWLAAVWERFDPWPDSRPGLARLKARYTICTLSNGSVRQLIGGAKHAGLPWDAVFSAELFGAYKPDPRVYQGALRLLQLAPEEVMMVASHVYDLRSARGHGLRTAFVARPLEYGPGTTPEQPAPGEFDFSVNDLEELAGQMEDLAT